MKDEMLYRIGAVFLVLILVMTGTAVSREPLRSSGVKAQEEFSDLRRSVREQFLVDWKTCEADEECDAVKVGCASWEPVNKKHVQDIVDFRETDYACLSTLPRPKPETACVEKICVERLVPPPAEVPAPASTKNAFTVNLTTNPELVMDDFENEGMVHFLYSAMVEDGVIAGGAMSAGSQIEKINQAIRDPNFYDALLKTQRAEQLPSYRRPALENGRKLQKTLGYAHANRRLLDIIYSPPMEELIRGHNTN